MSRLCIISHAHADADIARALATLIERVSLSNIRVWHSSDESRFGGIGAGQNWFETIIEKLKSGKVIIALKTKEGSERPWIYFESGFAAGQATMDVIPVAVGLKDANEIPAPISAYQAYALIDQRSVSKFLVKILALFDVKFDEEMSQSPIRTFVSEIGALTSSDRYAQNKNVAAPTALQLDHSAIIAHIDRKLSDFVDVARGRKQESAYAVDVEIDFPNLKSTVSMSVGTDDSVQDMMNSLWSILSKHVDAYTYLEAWILEDKVTGAKLVAREIMELIPAKYLFRPEIRWVARRLSTPYAPDYEGGLPAAFAFSNLSVGRR